jgi:hypothetical protein
MLTPFDAVFQFQNAPRLSGVAVDATMKSQCHAITNKRVI